MNNSVLDATNIDVVSEETESTDVKEKTLIFY